MVLSSLCPKSKRWKNEAIYPNSLLVWIKLMLLVVLRLSVRATVMLLLLFLLMVVAEIVLRMKITDVWLLLVVQHAEENWIPKCWWTFLHLRCFAH